MFNLVALFITIAGCLNWFAIGVFQFDIIAGIFGSQSVFVSRFIYTLIGICAIWILFLVLIKRGNLDLRTQKNKSNQMVKNENKDELNEKLNSDSESNTQL